MGETAAKSAWDKADVILKSAGSLATALAVGLVGYYGSSAINRRQSEETNIRVYADLMSRREDAETSLRKDMFTSIIQEFLKSEPRTLEPHVLQLELLAYNFHESLDLAPLFKSVYRRTDPKDPSHRGFRDRLAKAAREITRKQIGVLAEAGRATNEKTVDFEKLSANPGGIEVMRVNLEKKASGGHDPEQKARDTGDLAPRRFVVEVLDSYPATQEIRVRLRVSPPDGVDAPAGSMEIDTDFHVSFFDFPMIDNLRLSHGDRCAIVLNSFENFSASVTLVYFPGSRASLKEKPYYEEVMHQLGRDAKARQ